MLPTVEECIGFDIPVPRYTSYPTAPEWGSITSDCYVSHLQLLGASSNKVSLYFHIPFCKTMCLYCGCSVILNRKRHVEDLYVEYLVKEISLVASCIGSRKQVAQIHFGGGTPTQLEERHFEKIFTHIRDLFDVDSAAEIAIEIDPRTIVADDAKKLTFLRELGCNRVSFGVQDLDVCVQEAVRRRQTEEMTRYTIERARSLQFTSINVDLIYGLPFQTEQSFARTVSAIIEMSPDRIALFSYAKIPWLKPHQKAIREETLPSTEEKFRIYATARRQFIEAGYQAIGMDHFAVRGDELTRAYEQKSLHRNFQGYSVMPVEDLIGFGVTAIGCVQGAYFQNFKELSTYYEALNARTVPVFRGKVLTHDDHIRRWVIQKIMCEFRVDMHAFKQAFECSFEDYFSVELDRVQHIVKQGLVVINFPFLEVTPLGELFVRIIASQFDAYYHKKQPQKMFSSGI